MALVPSMRPKRQFGKAAKPSLGGSCFVRYSMARASRARSWQALAPTDATLVMSFGAVTATCPPANCMAKERLVNGWLALDLGVAAAPQIDGWWHPEGWIKDGPGLAVVHVPSSNLAPRGLFPDVCTVFPPLLTGGSQMQAAPGQRLLCHFQAPSTLCGPSVEEEVVAAHAAPQSSINHLFVNRPDRQGGIPRCRSTFQEGPREDSSEHVSQLHDMSFRPRRKRGPSLPPVVETSARVYCHLNWMSTASVDETPGHRGSSFLVR